NGHTQVNATDLRNIKYPTRAQLEALGAKIPALFPTQRKHLRYLDQRGSPGYGRNHKRRTATK
ncbi:MAG: hypothetical protein ACRDHZ_05975, partial [Ktedonobacteraceae bacterium]